METEVRKKYSIEFKISSVSTIIKYGSITHAAQKLGISKHNLFHWRKLHKDGKLILPEACSSNSTKDELLKLRKEVKNVKLERDIIKKELNIFSKRGC
ncbi:transposase [Flavobacterium sp. MC2016-06]|jgi:transposase-like protein|uniref:transposase n=1 Tax=Flavobacterium sp. MC2016-06 TaxID=2676308 RepID=UPI0012BA74B9|nr:transposase [Flavobacterium sp. MC2016-06]MBU3860631.1 transposase [Flavobacterium sp. MC2016-06]